MSGQYSGQLDQPMVVQITSETAHIVKVRKAVVEAAQQMGFAESDVSAIALAIDEAIANVIKHGYAGCPGKPIDVTIERVGRRDRQGLQVTICDCGRQVDPATIAGRELEDIRPGGLGTHIINTVCDEVEYTHRDPVGMQLRVVKLLETGPQQGSEDGETERDE